MYITVVRTHWCFSVEDVSAWNRFYLCLHRILLCLFDIIYYDMYLSVIHMLSDARFMKTHLLCLYGKRYVKFNKNFTWTPSNSNVLRLARHNVFDQGGSHVIQKVVETYAIL